MKIKFVILLLVTVFGIASANSGDIFVDNKKVFLKTTTIGNIEYVLPENLSSMFVQIEDFSEHRIFLRDSEIKFSAGSFFIVFESEKEMLVHQMPSPPVKYKGEIYLPVVGMMSAFNAFGIINAEISDKKINIFTDNYTAEAEKKEIEKKDMRNKRKPETDKDEDVKFPAFNAVAKEKNTSIAGEIIKPSSIHKTFYSLSGEIMQYYDYKKQIKDSIDFNRTEYPPDIYLLPQNLKRNKIE